MAPRALCSTDKLYSNLPALRDHLVRLLPAPVPAPGGEARCEGDTTQAGMRYARTTSCFTPPGVTCSSSPRSGPAYILASDPVPAESGVPWGQHRDNLRPNSGSHAWEAQCQAPPSITDPSPHSRDLGAGGQLSCLHRPLPHSQCSPSSSSSILSTKVLELSLPSHLY